MSRASRRIAVPVALALWVASVAGAARLGPSLQAQPAQTAPAAETGTEKPPTGWFCPMHPEVTSDQAGRCRKCDMRLIAGNPFDTREYLLDIKTSPIALQPQVPFTLALTVKHPGTGQPVTSFEVVHDKRLHLFVISEDMSAFQHIHPEQTPDGTWEIDVTVPKSGYYRVLADFVPTGGSPQFLGRTLVTSSFEGDIVSEAAHLAADASVTKTVDTITANLSLEPAPLLAGEYGHLTYTLTDAKTGQPVQDLQPYLGAFGHTLIVSEDLLDVVHSHPTGQNDVVEGLGGPRVTFEGYLPRPGMYRAWTQFLRNGQLSTFTYTFRALSVDEAYRLR